MSWSLLHCMPDPGGRHKPQNLLPSSSWWLAFWLQLRIHPSTLPMEGSLARSMNSTINSAGRHSMGSEPDTESTTPVTDSATGVLELILYSMGSATGYLSQIHELYISSCINYYRAWLFCWNWIGTCIAPWIKSFRNAATTWYRADGARRKN